MKYLIFPLSVALLSGCSLFSNRSSNDDAAGDAGQYQVSPSTTLNDDLIVQNLIFSITQLQELHPFSTTISMKQPRSDLGKLIEARFTDAGYGIQYVESDEGEYYVRHSAQNAMTEEGEKTTYQITVGSISVSRDFKLEGGQTIPNSVLRVDGPPEQDIVLNDKVFGDTFADTQFKEVYFEAGYTPEIVDVNESVVPVDAEPEVQVAVAETGRTSFKDIVQQNMRFLMRSNYASVFERYDDLEQIVLVFPNDSLRIGDKNKQTVQRYANSFNPETDVISVVGCSHGRTKIQQGNQLLALGRANRVKEALIFAGIDHSLIFEEGCWDNKHFDEVMPRRGVVLTHKRRAS